VLGAELIHAEKCGGRGRGQANGERHGPARRPGGSELIKHLKEIERVGEKKPRNGWNKMKMKHHTQRKERA
jgi:hypothetical protein